MARNSGKYWEKRIRVYREIMTEDGYICYEKGLPMDIALIELYKSKYTWEEVTRMIGSIDIEEVLARVAEVNPEYIRLSGIVHNTYGYNAFIDRMPVEQFTLSFAKETTAEDYPF